MGRIECIIEELEGIDEMLNKRAGGCVLAYAWYLDFAGDLSATDISEEDKAAAVDLFNEITFGYEVDKCEHMFAFDPAELPKTLEEIIG